MKRLCLLQRLRALLLISIAGFSCFPAIAQPSVVGQWSGITNLQVQPTHASVLANGKVMYFYVAALGNPRLWDPVTGTITTPPLPNTNIFCAGHSHVADGRLLVSGGHVENGWGLPVAYYYHPFSNTWTRLPDMNNGRWYPSSTTLSNGDVLVTSGSYNTNYAKNTLPQVWQVGSGTWRDLSSAIKSTILYPVTFLAPNGKIFFCLGTSLYLDTAGTGQWITNWTTASSNLLVSGRTGYGSAAMYDTGTIIYAGGGDPPTETAEIIDLNAANPSWAYTGSMSAARRQNNLTLLPDGNVMVNGGTSGVDFNNPTGAVLHAEMWNPRTGSWSLLATQAVKRLYHSTALLLPDGRVFSGGGNYDVNGVGTSEKNAEIFSPPYLFKATRPTLSSAPTNVSLGKPFKIVTPNGNSISKVSLTRLSSATHAQNWDQRINFLTFNVISNGLALDAFPPISANECPPGYYMLWLVDTNGGVSSSRMVKISNPGLTTYQQSTNSNALLSLDVENFDLLTVQGGKSWVHNFSSGYSGTRALQAMPNTGTTTDANYLTSAPRLDYRVFFKSTGTHYVWVRGWGANTNDASCHVGLNNTANTTADRISGFTNGWTWSRTTLDGPNATISISSTGLHTLNIWMRQDGLIIDKILLTTNATYVPTGKGSGQSWRQ